MFCLVSVWRQIVFDVNPIILFLYDDCHMLQPVSDMTFEDAELQPLVVVVWESLVEGY